MKEPRLSGRKLQSETETVTFEILKSLADRIRQTEFCEPWKVASDHLDGLYEDGRVTKVELDRTSIGWLPAVYNAIVKHVGRGGVSHYIRESFYLDMVAQGYKLAEVPVLKEGHVETAPKRKKAIVADTQPGRQSIVVPLVIPAQWKEFGDKVFPRQMGTAIKAATQKRLERETGKKLPVQARLGEWLGR
jgi:hypothetical protein